MNRLHVHLHVRDVSESVRFYSALFRAAPAKREPDYAKWMLDDPRVNFAISARGGAIGLGHLGIQVESEAELADVSARAKRAAGEVLVEKGANCCYAVSNKAWAEDPQGVRWETFYTTGDLTTYGVGAEDVRHEREDSTQCCVPAEGAKSEAASACCGGPC